MSRSPSIKKNTAFEKNPMNLNIKQGGMVSSPTVEDLENIDISMNFLKDLSTNNNTFIYFLQLIQTHMDIELLLDSTENSSNLYRRKTNNTISNDKITKLNNLLNVYFNTLSMIYLKNNNTNIPDDRTALSIFCDSVAENLTNEKAGYTYSDSKEGIYLFYGTDSTVYAGSAFSNGQYALIGGASMIVFAVLSFFVGKGIKKRKEKNNAKEENANA